MIDIHFHSNICVIDVQPFLTADDIHEIIDTAEHSNVDGVLLILRRIKKFTSHHQGQLVDLYKNLNEIHIKFGLVGLNDTNLQFIKISRLDRVFPIFDTLEDGLGGFQHN